jgi:hypothetical protein
MSVLFVADRRGSTDPTTPFVFWQPGGGPNRPNQQKKGPASGGLLVPEDNFRIAFQAV